MMATLAMTQTSPWDITRPTILSVSGGRTSMYMLRRYLDHHGGQLPEHAVAVFCNTGREHPKTLDFVQRCSTEWSCPIVWLEYQDADAPADRWRVVNHNSASRDGEPYKAAVRRKGFLPNSMTRFCTTELKIHLSHRWARAAWQFGSGRYVKAIGFRADFPDNRRVVKAKARCGTRKDAWDLVWPLFDEGVTKPQVNAWWERQPFDLEITDRHGNCDLCFLKSASKLCQNIEDDPSVADWWVEQEEATGKRFLSGYRSYADLRRFALSDAPKPWKQGEMLGFDALELECACTD